MGQPSQQQQHLIRRKLCTEIAPENVRNAVNLRRLLERCEEMVLEGKFSWRLTAYVDALEDLMKTVKKQVLPRPTPEELNDVRKRIDFIKGAIQMEAVKPEMKLVEQTKVTRHPKQDVHQRERTKVNRELRVNLFDRVEREHTHDVDRILAQEDVKQRKIADNMLSFAQDLKRNAQIAKNIIAKDNELVKRNLQTTDDNFGKLKTEAVRLEEQLRSPCSFQFMMWIMLAIVIVVFPCMVIFIRLFPKRL